MNDALGIPGTLESSVVLSQRAQRVVRNSFAIVCAAAIALLFIPQALVVAAAVRLAPDHLLEEKTVALLGALQWVMPIVGVLGIIWILLAPRARSSMRNLAIVTGSSRWSLPVILVLATVVRVAWLYWFPTRPYADSVGYIAAATQLVNGHGYVWDAESMQPLVGWPVGYPAILAALFLITGVTAETALALNLVVSVLTVAQTAWLGSLLFGRRVGLMSALLLALFPGFVVYTSLVSTELVFLWLTSLCYLLAARPPQRTTAFAPTVNAGIAAGIMAGAGALVRSTGLLLLPFWVFVRWSSQRNVKQAALWAVALFATAALIVLPWTARNYLTFGKIIPVSTNGGMNFWIGNNPNSHGAYMFPHDPALNPLYPLAEQRDEIGMESEGYRLGSAWIRATLQTDPKRIFVLYGAKIVYFVSGFDFGLQWNTLSAMAENQSGTGLRAHVLVNGAYLAMLAGVFFGVLALMLARGHGTLLQWGPLLFYLYWLAVHMPFFGQDRFMLPALPGLIIFSALGALTLFDAVLATPSHASRGEVAASLSEHRIDAGKDGINATWKL